MVEIYQPKESARVMPLPRRLAGAYGAAQADALGALGRTGQAAAQQQAKVAEAERDSAFRVAEIERRRRQQSERSALLVRLAENEAAERIASTELRSQAGPGGEGYVPAVRKRLDDFGTAFLGSIADPELREEFAPRVAGMGAQLAVQAEEYALGARADLAASNYQAAADLGGNSVHGDPSPANIARQDEAMMALIDGFDHLGPDVKAKLKREWGRTRARQALLGTARDNPAAALEMVRSGAFNADLDAEGNDAAELENRFEVDLRQIESERREAETLTLSATREEARLALKQIGDGIAIDPGRLLAMAAAMEAAGDATLGYDLRTAGARAGINRETETWPAERYEGRIAELAAMGDTRSAAQAIELGQLRAIAPARIAEQRTNPWGRAARLGRPPPTIDWNDPATIARRAAAARANGVPRFFTPQEAATLAETARSGAKGRLAAINQVAAIGAFDPALALAAARQVAPDDAVFARAVTLPRRYRVKAIEGAELRRQNGALVPRADSQAAFDERAGRALRYIGADFGTATLETARSLYAARMAETGQSEWNDALFDQAIDMALGADRVDGVQRGGVGEWRGTPILLPQGMSQEDFDRRMARLPATLPAGSANGLPVFRDGSAMNTDFLRRRTAPVQVGDGRYMFELPDGSRVKAKDGSDWLLDIRKVGG